MKAVKYTLIAFAVLVVGCNSFNNWNFKPSGTDSRPHEFNYDAGAAVSDADLKCSIYTFPEMPAVPSLPIEELAKSAANSEAIDAIQQKHIEDLRRYIVASRKVLRLSYAKYLEDCRAKSKVLDK